MTETISSLFELCFASIGAVLQFDDILKVFLGYVILVVLMGIFFAVIGVGLIKRKVRK